MSINLFTHKWAENSNHSSQFFPEISSTNDVAKKEFAEIKKDFHLYLSDHQTQGRGRNQSIWQNLSQGEILLSTWCFRSQKALQPLLTPRLGLALYESLFETWPKELPFLRIKAPNDIYIGDKKLSGLLVEISQQGSNTDVFIGLGLNVFGKPKIEQPTTSLTDFVDQPKDKWFLFCDRLLQKWEEVLEIADQEELSKVEQGKLLKALNVGVSADKEYLNISPKCDLSTREKEVSWMDL